MCPLSGRPVEPVTASPCGLEPKEMRETDASCRFRLSAAVELNMYGTIVELLNRGAVVATSGYVHWSTSCHSHVCAALWCVCAFGTSLYIDCCFFVYISCFQSSSLLHQSQTARKHSWGRSTMEVSAKLRLGKPARAGVWILPTTTHTTVCQVSISLFLQPHPTA